MQYNLFCCSDTHASIPPSPTIEVLASLHAGDFYNRGTKNYRTMFGDKALALLDWVESIKKPESYFSVRGNHDGNDEVSFFSKTSEITGKAVRIADDLVLVGVGWYGRYHYDLPEEHAVEAVCISARKDMERLAKTGDSFIILSHYPAYTPEVFETNAGGQRKNKPLGWMFDCVRELIDDVQPMVVVAGHVHELAGQQAVYSGKRHASLLVFPGPKGGVLTCSTDTMTARFMPTQASKTI